MITNRRREGSSPRIAPDEHRNRLQALCGLVEQSRLDLFIVSSAESVYYLTGASYEPLERPFFLLVRARQEPMLLAPRLEYEHMKKMYTVSENQVRSYAEYPAPEGYGWPEALRELIGEDREVGVEPSLPQMISAELAGPSLHVMPLVERLRMVKSPAEIAMIRRAARFADFAVERLIETSYFGSTVAEGFAEARTVTSRIVREVDHWEPLTTKVTMATWAAPRSAMPHAIPELTDRLDEGPHVALALTRVNGYAAECERTYFTVPPSDGIRRVLRAVTEARRIAFGMIRPGLSCAELDATLNEFLAREGYADQDQRLHRTGHGFGLSNHEPPWIAEGSQDRLAQNMVISIEPGVYIKGVGGVRHSDTVRVTENGYEMLTHYPSELDQLVDRGWKTRARVKGAIVRWSLGLNTAGA